MAIQAHGWTGAAVRERPDAMLQNTTRPYFRASTGELAALVDAGQDLPGIAAELAHRNRRAARALAARVADMLRSGASVVALRDADTDQPVAVQIERGEPFRRAADPAVILCEHGEVIPDQRETVVSVERVKPADAPARRKAKAKGTAAPDAPEALPREYLADYLRRHRKYAKSADAKAALPALAWREYCWRFRREVVPLPDHIEVGAQERARIRDAFQAWRERDAAERAEWEARQTEAQRLVLQAWASQDMPERIAAYTHRRWQGRADRPVAQKFSSDFRDRVFRRFSKMIRRQHGISPEPMPV